MGERMAFVGLVVCVWVRHASGSGKRYCILGLPFDGKGEGSVGERSSPALVPEFR